MDDNEADELRLQELEDATEFLSRKWRPLIVYTLLNRGSMGFNDLKQSLGDISGKVLSENLEDLCEKNYLNKNVLSQSPKRVSYSLTSKGERLDPILEKMLEWAKDNDDSRKIMIVEDEPKLSELYSEWLSSNYETVKASTGSEATEKIDSDVDLVLLDRSLPDTSGEKVAEMISKHFEPQVVFLTAKDPEIEVADMEIDEYIVKPVSAEKLVSKAEEIIGRKDKEKLKQELLALVSRKEIIEEDYSEEELKGEEKYQKLIERIEELEEKLNQS